MKEGKEKRALYSHKPTLRIGNLHFDIGGAVEQALVQTNFLELQSEVEEKRMKELNTDKLPLIEAVNCAIIAAEIAALEWQNLHETIHEIEVQQFENEIKSLGGQLV